MLLYGFFLVVALHNVDCALPPGWKACKLSSKDYAKCLSDSIDFAVSSLKEGNKKLQVSPIDPLVFKSLMINQANGPVSIKLELSNFAFKGLVGGKFTAKKNDWKVLEGEMFHKEIRTNGLYTINGKVLILPIVGNGTCSIIWSNMTTDVTIKFKEATSKGKTFFEVTQFLLNLKPQRVKFQFDNLFNGDKALGDNMNIFLNENWKEIIDEVKPGITQGLSVGFGRVANQVFSKIPKNELLIK